MARVPPRSLSYPNGYFHPQYTSPLDGTTWASPVTYDKSLGNPQYTFDQWKSPTLPLSANNWRAHSYPISYPESNYIPTLTPNTYGSSHYAAPYYGGFSNFGPSYYNTVGLSPRRPIRPQITYRSTSPSRKGESDTVVYPQFNSFARSYSSQPYSNVYNRDSGTRYDAWNQRGLDHNDEYNEETYSRGLDEENEDYYDEKPPMDFTLDDDGYNSRSYEDWTDGPSTLRIPESRLQALHEKLYQQGRDRALRLQALENSVTNDNKEPKKLPKKKVKEVVERLNQKGEPRIRYYDEHQPKTIKLSSSKQKQAIQRLYSNPGKKEFEPKLPEQQRKNYIKLDEDDMERLIERITRLPPRYQPPPPRQEIDKKKLPPEWKRY